MYYLVKTQGSNGLELKVMTAKYLARKLCKNSKDHINKKVIQVYNLPSNCDKDLLAIKSNQAELDPTKWISIPSDVIYNTFCINYIILESTFYWILDRYLKKDYIEYYRTLAFYNMSEELYNHLNKLWYALPDSVFNFEVNPVGWSEFVSLIDDYKSISKFITVPQLTKILINGYTIVDSEVKDNEFNIIHPDGNFNSTSYSSKKSAIEAVNKMILKDHNIILK